MDIPKVGDIVGYYQTYFIILADGEEAEKFARKAGHKGVVDRKEAKLILCLDDTKTYWEDDWTYYKKVC